MEIAMKKAQRRMKLAGTLACIVMVFAFAPAVMDYMESGPDGAALTTGTDFAVAATLAAGMTGLGVGTFCGSRVCSILLFGIYCVDRTVLFVLIGQSGTPLGAIPPLMKLMILLSVGFVVVFVYGVFGAFACQILKKGETGVAS